MLLRRLSRLLLPASLVVAPAALAAACSAASGGDISGGTGGASTAGDGGIGGADFDGGTGTGLGDAACGKSTYVNQLPGSVLLVFDRSLSMLAGDGIPERWGPSIAAIQATMDAASPDLRMGLLPFPEGLFPYDQIGICAQNPAPSCAPLFTDFGCTDVGAGAAVPVGPLSVTKVQIAGWLAAHQPLGGTPTLVALQTAYQIMGALDTKGSRYVLLLTDGIPTLHSPPQTIGGLMLPETGIPCGDFGDIYQVTADALSALPKIRTFVVGSPASPQGAAFLSQLAVLGGTPRSPDCSIEAGECHHEIGHDAFQEELTAALAAITGEVSDCVFEMPDGPGVDPDYVNVVIETPEGQNQLARDATHGDGWDYTDGQKSGVQLFGPACAAYEDHPGAKVSILLGCKTIVK